MFKSNIRSALFLSGVAALALTGCSQPHMFPTGYVYHGDTYKSATPPPSAKFSDEQRKTMTAEQADQFRHAVYQLTEKLTLRAGMPPKPVFVLRPEKMSPFYSNIDNNLNESLRHLGYNLASSPQGAYIFTYKVDLLRTASDLKNPDGSQIDPASLSSNNVRVALQVHDKIGPESKMLTEEIGTFYIAGAEYMTVPYISFQGVHVNDDGKIPVAKQSPNFSATAPDALTLRPGPASVPASSYGPKY